MISGGIFDVAHKQSSLEDINNRLSDESTWSNLELSQSLNKEKADLEKFLNSFSFTPSIAAIIDPTASIVASLLPGDTTVSPSKKLKPF